MGTIQRDLPAELIHRIQSLLSVKEAARTSVLCKSWLHAWRTIPILRFPQSLMLFNKQSETKFRKLIHRTVKRYLRNQIPIESFLLQIYIENHDSAYLAEKLIRRVAPKHLSVTVRVMIDSFTLPYEILFSGANLSKLSVVSTTSYMKSLSISSNNSNPVIINCVSLRELELIDVHISEELLNSLLSTCKLLETVILSTRLGMKKIKVTSLHRLRQLKVTSFEHTYIMEIADVPSLSSFTYDSSMRPHKNPLSITLDSLRTLTELCLGGVMISSSFFDMIQSSLPFLETLSLKLGFDWTLDSLHITCVSLKRLTVSASHHTLTHLHVFAPKLLHFSYNGYTTIPRISFPAAAPKQITLNLQLCDPVEHSFLLNMRETLDLSSTFDIVIHDACRYDPLFPSNFDVDALRTRLPSPANNVQQLSLSTFSDKRLWEDSQYFDVFFSVCRPTYVDAFQFKAFKDTRRLYKVMARMATEKKTRKGFWSDLKDVQIKDPIRGHWQTLADYWKSFPDASALGDWYHAEFKLICLEMLPGLQCYWGCYALSIDLFTTAGDYEIAWIDFKIEKTASDTLSSLPLSTVAPALVRDLNLKYIKQYLAGKGIQVLGSHACDTINLEVA